MINSACRASHPIASSSSPAPVDFFSFLRFFFFFLLSLLPLLSSPSFAAAAATRRSRFSSIDARLVAGDDDFALQSARLSCKDLIPHCPGAE